ncbi:hypothetical protein S40293_10081, partial [Stachybotrys chartarum IBT 40293]
IKELAQKLRDLEQKFTELEQKYNTINLNITAPASAPLVVEGEKEQTTSSEPPAVASGDEPGESKDGEKKPPPRVKVIISKRDEDGAPIESTEDTKVSENKDNSPHAFVLKKNIYDRGSREINDSEIEITNPDLWDLLKQQLGNYRHIFRGSPVTLDSPYEQIVFKWDELWALTCESGDEDNLSEARKDLRLLLDSISGGASGDEKLDKYFRTREKNKEGPERIQYNDLWTIFPPGTLVYGTPFQCEDQVFVVEDNRMPWPPQSPYANQDPRPWELKAWSYDWKDGFFQRISFTLLFEHFEGHVPITSLPYYPFVSHPDREKVQDRLIERGKQFRNFCSAAEGSRLFEYSGEAIPEQRGFSGMINDEVCISLFFIFFIAGRVMVDYASYFQYGPADGRNGALEPNNGDRACNCSDCAANEGLMQDYRTRFDKQGHLKSWEDEQYLICPPRVLGYILLEKRWAQLQVTKLSPIREEEPENAWKSRLKLKNEKETKGLLFDLVTSHKFSNPAKDDNKRNGLEVDDIIPGKGKGLVVLLYGPPGVGKTSTAETIAEATRKPLFSVSVADVGTKAKHVEANLAKIFSLATSWQAILLIDEADVFLESRGRGATTQSTDKNALVSVFLRVLEYYQGIMFLTTNQIADFDVAIVSRIHVAIQYESLDKVQMHDIFTGFLDKLDNQGLIEDYEGIKSWLNEDVFGESFDGRQIRNIVTTALGLARAERSQPGGKGQLTQKHMKKAFTNVRKFKSDFRVQMEQYKLSQHKMIR